MEDLVYVHLNLRLTTHKDNAYQKGKAKYWDIELVCVDLEDLIVRLDALAVDDDHHKLPCDVEDALEAKIANIDASGTICASNLQQIDDDDI